MAKPILPPRRRSLHGLMLPGNLQTNHLCDCPDGALPEVMRLLSFNIQVGINTQKYHHYLTRSCCPTTAVTTRWVRSVKCSTTLTW